MNQFLRRNLLLGSAAAGLAAVSTAAQAGAAATNITRSRYGMSKDFHIPKANFVTQIPLDVIRFEEAGDTTMLADGTIRINTKGLYRICVGLDWKAQEDTDIDCRMYGSRRKLASDSGPPNLQDERLASVDVPGSDPPRMGRYQGAWTPPVVPYGGMVYTEVTVGPNDVTDIGDFAMAELTSATDANLGVEANTALQISARVVAKNKVRVMLANPYIPAGIVVPAGNLQVVAMSATTNRGGSEDAWNVVQSPLVSLKAGDRVYIAAKNLGVANDYIQATLTSFLQTERHA
jgi:hypothetical protein